MWEKQKKWFGNPRLGLASYKKDFKTKYLTRTIPVFIFGSDKRGWLFVVHAGAYSDYSYTGGFPEDITTLEQRMEFVDHKHSIGKLIC